jgi:AraC-like DNA-binding protein
MIQEIQMFFSLFVGTLGLIIVFILLFSYKSNKIVNGYLAIVFSITSLRSISSVLDTNNMLFFKHVNTPALYSITLVALPCFFLYLESIIKNINSSNKIKILHLIFPAFLFLYFILFNNPNYLFYNSIIYIFQVCVILFITFYFIQIIYLYYKYIYNEKGFINSHVLDKSTKKWINFLLLMATLIIMRILIVLIFETYTNTNFSGHTISIIQSLLMLFVFLKILCSPEILHGFPKLIHQISNYNEEKINNNLIWKTSIVKITNIQDSTLKNNISDKVNKYILKIDKFVENNKPFRDSKYSINELSNDLNIPSSHLTYIFKYHCEMSFVEYKNHSKVNDSINLINSNYLEFKTLDALAYKVGFNSYNSFFIYFKKQTNLSPKEYLLNKDIILE